MAKRKTISKDNAKPAPKKEATEFICAVETSQYGNPYLQFCRIDENGYRIRFAAINGRQAQMVQMFASEVNKLASMSSNGKEAG